MSAQTPELKFDIAGIRRRKAGNTAMLALTGVLALIALVPLFWILGYVIYRGGKAVDLNFLMHNPAPLGMTDGGVLHAIEGTLIMTALACLFAIPAGIVAAFYAARNPNAPLGIAVRFSTDMLAGVPSIVVGLFVYSVVVVPQKHFSALAGGIALAILMLPTIVRTTEEMIKLVPPTLREASVALGAPEWKTSVSVILPAALNGIVTGFLLGVARAAGETAPLLFTALGNERFDLGRIVRSGVQSHQNVFQIAGRVLDQPVDSLPLTLWKYASMPYPERVEQAWGIALVLLLLVLALNLSARLWIAWRVRKMKG